MCSTPATVAATWSSVARAATARGSIAGSISLSGSRCCCPNDVDTSALAAVAAEHRLDVDERRTVHGLEVAYPEPAAVDRYDLHAMESDRIRAVGRAGVENALRCSRDVAARVNS